MNGIINILKPPGFTSAQVVTQVKRTLHMKKVGHCGTLDPGASGVLPIMLGKATKLFDILCENKKEYIARFTFGIQTNTSDSYGEIIATDDKIIKKEDFILSMDKFVGDISQTPSKFSAVHIDGKKAYKYAYKGQEIELPKRNVNIFELELLDMPCENTFLVRILCSKGTYVRSICEDIAKDLGSLAYLSFLLRTKSSGFSIEDAITLEQLEDFKAEYLISIENLVENQPKLLVKQEFTKQLYNGNKLDISICFTDNSIILDNTEYIVCDHAGTVVGLGRKDEDILRVHTLLI